MQILRKKDQATRIHAVVLLCAALIPSLAPGQAGLGSIVGTVMVPSNEAVPASK